MSAGCSTAVADADADETDGGVVAAAAAGAHIPAAVAAVFPLQIHRKPPMCHRPSKLPPDQTAVKM